MYQSGAVYMVMPTSRSFFIFFIEQDYGHRVRLATHANFKEFVLTAGLEFYPLGGDPKVLAECMSCNFFIFFVIIDIHLFVVML